MAEINPNNLLVCTLRPVEVGETFARVPLHVTIQPWFSLQAGLEQAFYNAMSNRMHDMAPFQIVGGEAAHLGAKGDVPVRLLRRIGGLASLRSITDELVHRFGQPADPDMESREYKPHVTFQDGGGLAEDEQVEIRAIQLFRKSPDNLRSVERVYYFGNRDETTA